MANLGICDRTIVCFRIPFPFPIIQNLVIADAITRREIPLAIGNALQQRVFRGILLAHGGIKVFRQANKLLNGQPINGFGVLLQDRTPPLFDSLYPTIGNILLVDSIPHVLCQFFSNRVVRLKLHASLVSNELTVGQVIFLMPRQLQVLVCLEQGIHVELEPLSVHIDHHLVLVAEMPGMSGRFPRCTRTVDAISVCQRAIQHFLRCKIQMELPVGKSDGAVRRYHQALAAGFDMF